MLIIVGWSAGRIELWRDRRKLEVVVVGRRNNQACQEFGTKARRARDGKRPCHASRVVALVV
jgi:hypothetical protein